MKRERCALHAHRLFPLVPLGMELPHYIRSKPLLYWSTATWLVIPSRYYASLWPISTEYSANNGIKTAIAIIWIVLTFETTFSTILAIHAPAKPSTIGVSSSSTYTVRLRLRINLLYCIQLGFPVFSYGFYMFGATDGWFDRLMSLFFWFATCFFGVATVLYVAAHIKRHSWVSSTLFGGTGIEPMVLWLSGTGPPHQSVGNEAQEGAVRLV
jgi:hypothetical protein